MVTVNLALVVTSHTARATNPELLERGERLACDLTFCIQHETPALPQPLVAREPQLSNGEATIGLSRDVFSELVRINSRVSCRENTRQHATRLSPALWPTATPSKKKREIRDVLLRGIWNGGRILLDNRLPELICNDGRDIERIGSQGDCAVGLVVKPEAE